MKSTSKIILENIAYNRQFLIVLDKNLSNFFTRTFHQKI